jgi:hypothetical protein
MQSCNKSKELRNTLKGSKISPRGEKWETQKQGLMQLNQPSNQRKGSKKQTSKKLRRFWNQCNRS